MNRLVRLALLSATLAALAGEVAAKSLVWVV